MTLIVIDASALLRTLSQHEVGSSEATTLLAGLLDDGTEIAAPDLLPYEVGHGLRRHTASDEARSAALDRVVRLVRLLRPSPEQRRQATVLAREASISFYDASYIVTARASHAPLWTEDRELLAKFPDVAASTAALVARRSTRA